MCLACFGMYLGGFDVTSKKGVKVLTCKNESAAEELIWAAAGNNVSKTRNFL